MWYTQSMQRNHNEKFNFGKVRLMSMISLLFGFADAFVIYLVSSYFEQVAGTDNVSWLYLISFVVFLASLLYADRAIRSLGASFSCVSLLAFSIAINALLVFLSPSWLTVGLLMAHIVVSNILWMNLDILLESFSTDGRSGRIRGLYMTASNMGWVLGPFFSGTLLNVAGFSSVFFVGLVLYAVTMVVALIGLRSTNFLDRHKKEKSSWMMSLRLALKRRNIVLIYVISCALEFFYSVMIVYTPLYLLKLGFDWHELGIIFTVMLIPFIVVQYPLGVVADKWLGEKEMLIVCLVIAACSTMALPFVGTGSVLVWSIALLLTRIGAAGADILKDAYFYKCIDSNEAGLIALFRTARPIANIMAVTIVGISLLWLPLTAVFFIAAVILFLSLIPALSLIDSSSEYDIARQPLSVSLK